jgi:site-specific DNA recombinase
MGLFGNIIMQKAIIYCRVSSDKQVREGHGLEGQEKRCRDYAVAKGYEIIRVFRDAGVSGSLTNRPAMQSLISYLREMRFSEVVIIFDDIKRFARNVEGHFELKAMLMSHGAKLESPSHRFEDSPEGKLVESIFASVAEYERNANKSQVSNRMKARMQLGYWVLYPPTGYKHEKHPIEGKLIAPVEPTASIIKEAMEGFASGVLGSQEDVRQFLIKKKFPYKGKTVHPEQVKRILTQSLYAGIIDYPKWGIKPFQARHKALVSPATFNKIQDKLFGRAKQPFIRKSDNDDFPIRGFALCPACSKPYTGSWSKGRNTKYPYYRCNNKQCANAQKSVKKDVLENLFTQALQMAAPAKQVVNLAKAITLDVFNQKLQQLDLTVSQAHYEIKKLDKQIDEATNKLIEAKSAAVQAALEKKIEEIERQRHQIQQSTDNLSNHKIDFGTALNAMMTFIENPHDAWVRGDLKQKKLVQRLVFARPMALHPSQAIGTADLSLPFKLLKENISGKNELVGRRQSHHLFNLLNNNKL